MERAEQIALIRAEYEDIYQVLNEKSLRWWCASKARSYNRLYEKGGISIVSAATGISRARIRKGIREVELGVPATETKSLRKKGGGRKKNNSNSTDSFK